MKNHPWRSFVGKVRSLTFEWGGIVNYRVVKSKESFIRRAHASILPSIKRNIPRVNVLMLLSHRQERLSLAYILQVNAIIVSKAISLPLELGVLRLLVLNEPKKHDRDWC